MPTHMRRNRQGKLFDQVDWLLAAALYHARKQGIHGLLDMRPHALDVFTSEERFDHAPNREKFTLLDGYLSSKSNGADRCCMCSGASISTKKDG